MKKLLSVVLVMLLAVGMTGCGSSSNGKTELLIGVSPDYPPYESYNNKKEMVGFDIDMTKELVKIMNKNGGNYSYKFKALSFDAIEQGLKTYAASLNWQEVPPSLEEVFIQLSAKQDADEKY